MASIVFPTPDQSRPASELGDLLDSLGRAPMLGLLIKVKEGPDGDEIVNWMFADPAELKSLLLVLPARGGPGQEKE
jgi:hypothetical protein